MAGFATRFIPAFGRGAYVRLSGVRLKPRVVVTLAALVALFLRTWQLPELGDFDFDEVASVWYARLVAVDLLQAISTAPFEHPPLYYLTLHYWTKLFGEHEPLVRLLSVPAGVALVPVTYALGARLLGTRSGMVASVIVATSPTLIFYSREARMYIFATLFGFLALYLLIRAFERGGIRAWLAYGLVSLAGAFLDYSALMGVLAGNVYLLSNWKRNKWVVVRLLAAQAVVIAALFSWMLTSPGVQASVGAFGKGTLTYGLISHAAHEGWLNMTTGIGNVRGGRASVGIAVLLGGTALVGFILAAWRRRAGSLHAYAVLAGIGLLILLLFGQEYQPRYLMMGIPIIALFAGYAVTRLRLPDLAIAGLAAVLFAAGPLYASRFYYLGYERGDYRAITSAINELSLPMSESERPGKFRDAVVLAGPWQGWFWRHYYPEFLETVDVWLLPDKVPPAVTKEEVEAKLGRAAESHRRVWVILSALNQSDPNGYVEDWLNSRLWKARDSAYRNGMLLLYITKASDMVIREQGFIAFEGGPDVLSIEFAGAREDQPPKETGNGIRFTFRLFSNGPADPDLAIRAWLEGPDGRIYERIFRPLAQDARKPHHWIPGERIVAKTAVWIPAGAPAGNYEAYASFIHADRVPIDLDGRLTGVYQNEPGILHLGPAEIVPSSRGLLDDSEIYEKFGAPLHERTMEDVESRSIYHGSLHER
ncbi:MAG: glycosyltransferase family 39 protein [Chloroflexi bacterium]|nr:glycosyltransferase family 39 protein [Chloroflexota bacterium]MCY3936905.1 glycosyltransferase family 39 protein [Chloroflexota bacterium]